MKKLTRRTRSKKLNRSKKVHKYLNKKKLKGRTSKRNKRSKRKKSKRSKKMKGGFTHFYIPEITFKGLDTVPDLKVSDLKMDSSIGRFLEKKCLKS